jgi:4-amino-4-deoxy-L-arabinose transferase
MRFPLQKNLIVPLVFSVAAFFLFLFYRGLIEPDEGRYSEIPREMVKSGNWLEMRLLGYRYYEKPPLTYWITAVPIKIFGAKDWAVRIPLLFNAIALIAAFYWLLNRYWKKEQVLLALLFMFQTVGFITTGLLIPDAYLMLWFAISVISFFKAMEEDESKTIRRLALLLLAGIAAACGVLTKGFIALLLPAAIFGIWVLWAHKSIKAILRYGLAGAFVIGVAILCLLPAFYIIEKHNPGFIKQFIFEEHIARFTGTRAIQVHLEPWYFFLLIILVLLIPLTLFLLRAGKTIISSKQWKNDKIASFFLVWVFVVVGFFSLSRGKLMTYILPAFPPLALLVIRYGILEQARAEEEKTDMLWKIGAAVPLVMAIAIIPTWLLFYFKLVPGKEAYGISGISSIALLPVLCVLVAVFIQKRCWRKEVVALLDSSILLSAAILLSPIAGRDFNVLARANSSCVYKALAKEMQEKDRIVEFHSYHPAISFYTEHIYKPYQDHNELVYGMKIEPERPDDLDNIEELQQWIAEEPEGRIFIVLEPHVIQTEFPALNIKTRQLADLPSDPETIILEILRE